MKIAIIKLGAKGDVVRTLPILISLKEKYPDSEITWITKPSSLEILKTSPYIDNIISLPAETDSPFDILYNFDIEEEATNLATSINATKKYGFYFEEGYPQTFNLPAENYLNTLFDDEIKRTNKKTYQELMFEAAELNHSNKPHHPILLSENDKQYAIDFANSHNIETKNLIGIHIGSSPRWPSKSWHKENLMEFIIKAKEKNYEILLFGGPEEIESLNQLTTELFEQGIKVHQNNPQNSDLEFSSLINLCKTIVSGDTFALHVALALKKPTIGLFFCTSPDEIESYNLLKKITSPRLYDFFPEKMDQYDEELTKSISPEEVLEALNEINNQI